MEDPEQWYNIFFPGNSNGSIFELNFDQSRNQSPDDDATASTYPSPSNVYPWTQSTVASLQFSNAMCKRLFDEQTDQWVTSNTVRGYGNTFVLSSGTVIGNSNTEGYLPDIEATFHALSMIENSGMIDHLGGSFRNLPDWFLEKMARWVNSLQDPNGYFYHPQWGKAVSATRKGRDCGWAWRMITPLGRKTKYLRVTERSGRTDVQVTLPEHLQSLELFKEWMVKYDLKTKSYPFGNLINSTASQIKAAGPEYVKTLVDYLNENQYPENGLWQPEVNYDAVNGLMKFGITYPTFGATLPYPEKSYESARTAIMSDEPVIFSCQFYNAWAALRCSLSSLEAIGDTKRLEELRSELRRDAAPMIRKTGEKMLKTRCDDGNFAYYSADSGKFCDKSQGAPVSPYGIREADVNGNGCSTRGPLRYMFAAFGVEMPPIFTPEDAEFVFELMSARSPVVKIYPHPDN